MTDFRYHVVSLVAVFLALAVGIVLGSGPLRSVLVGDLSDEVTGLEQDLADAQAELDQQGAEFLIADQFADEIAPYAIDGVLAGQSVALIAVEGADASAVDAQRARLVEAGASITADVVVEQAWTDPDQSAFRTALAAEIAPNVVGVDEVASGPRLLAHALAQALMPTAGPADGLVTDPDSDFPDETNASDRADVLLDLLREADLVDGTVTGDVTAVVIVAGSGADDVDERADQSDSMATLAGVLAEYANGVVASSGPDADGDLPSAILNDSAAATTVSTVTFGTTINGRIATALALGEAVGGGHGHYGPGEDRTLVPENVTPVGASGVSTDDTP